METVVKRAQQEAKREFELNLYSPTARERIAYIKGATFAATVTAEQVEAGARDLYYEEANDSDGFDAWPEWESHDNPTRDIWRLRVESMVRAMGFRVGADA